MSGQVPADEIDALLALNLTHGIGQGLSQRLLEHFGAARTAIESDARAWAMLDRLSLERATKLKRSVDRTLEEGNVEAERERIDRHGAHLVSIHDAAYPALLKHIPDPPQLLWVRGELREEDALALGIVGSRRCTHYGREQADRFAADAASAGLCVVSGGAHGIDAAAHRAALRLGGRTLAVVGSGLANPYPKEHHDLFDQIAAPGAEANAEGGAVLSELPMTAPTQAENFPRRNRIISGLALGVLVVEAAARSGALITARLCVEQHGRELMAVPGRVDSKASEGCHRMIRQGWATLVTGGAEVLDALGETGQLLKAGMSQPPGGGSVGGINGDGDRFTEHDGPRDGEGSPGHGGEEDAGSAVGLFSAKLSETQQKIVEALDQPRTLDQLVAATDLEAGRVQSELTLMELHGTIERRGGLLQRRRG